MTRPSRYTENNSSRDWIDEFIATSTTEEVRGAFRFTIGKYLRRYGKKDDPLQEAIKIQDYANRLVSFERELAAPDHVELRRHPMTPNVIEPDTTLFAGECLACGAPGGHGGLQCPKVNPNAAHCSEDDRMDIIARNGNCGEHYAELMERRHE